MADRQQVIILHCALSVKYTLHQNVNSRLRFTEETYRDLQEKLRRERQKLTSFFYNDGARGLSELLREKLVDETE